jgi:hypothetical protein
MEPKMVYLFARTDSRGVILKKVAFIKAKNKEEALQNQILK